ncbi:nuclear autoantigen Sp-100 isoform 2-T2 [Trichechus inunguis]
MTGGNGHLSAMMSIVNQDRDRRLVYETVFSHYRKHKVDMANAIKKPFPFLEGLRDRDFISNKMYQDSEESCRNLVPIQRVVYNVLDKLEKTFDLALLEALFSEVNMKEYPELICICRSFKNAIEEISNPQEQEEKETLNSQPRLEQGNGENFHRSLPWLLADLSSRVDTTPPENGRSEHCCETEQINAERKDPTSDENDAPGSQQANQRCAQESEPAGSSEQISLQANNGDARQEVSSPLPSNEENTTPPENGRSEHCCETEQINAERKDPTSDENDAPGSQQANQRCAQESEPAGSSEQISLQVNNGDARQEVSSPLPSNEEMISSGDSAESSEEGEPPAASTSALRSQLELSEREEPQEATCSQSQMTPEPMDFRKSPIFRKRVVSYNSSSESSEDEVHWKAQRLVFSSEPSEEGRMRRRPRKHLAQRSRVPLKRRRPRGIKRVNTGPLKRRRRRRRPTFPRDKNMNFQSPKLPVTCGKVKGILHKDMLKQGSWIKCIQSEDGRWFTPREFEIAGNYEKAKNWKTSLRCGGETLSWLLKRRFLPNPPTARKKRRVESPNSDLTDAYPENSNRCEVCQDGGKLFCCDTCPKSFHEDCHIQPVEAERDPWSCIFCRIKAIQQRSLESQPCHQETEILRRQMLPEEKLKCEFLLLKVCCWTKSPFFAFEPYYSEQGFQGPREPMWLNKIKERLKEERYHRVDEFVQDMRLIFQNHMAYYRDRKFARLGLQLEAIFEKNFKDIFAIQENNE